MLCQSTYLAKRKGGKRTRRDSNEFSAIVTPNHKDNWEIPDNLSKKYGNASGDKNPIHSSIFFAKDFGFSSSILQGWHGVSRLVKECEEKNNEVNRTRF